MMPSEDVVLAPQADLIGLAAFIHVEHVYAAPVQLLRDAGELGAGQFVDFLRLQALGAGRVSMVMRTWRWLPLRITVRSSACPIGVRPCWLRRS